VKSNYGLPDDAPRAPEADSKQEKAGSAGFSFHPSALRHQV
jgi:hypothetical protein